MDTTSRQKASAIRNLQPRAAAAIYHNDSDDDEGGARVVSADYRAQHKTTLELIDFFKNAPPPPPTVPSLPPVAVDEKKKRTLLQRLRSRKSSLSKGGRDSNRTANAGPPPAPSKTSSLSTKSTYGEVATLPNGKKYIMIAVDYKDKEKEAGAAAVASTVGANTSKRLSLISEDSRSKHDPRLGIQITTTFQEDADTKGINGSNGRASMGSDKRRSIIIQAGGGEGSSFSLDNTPFLLDSFALDADYVMPSSGPTDPKQATDGASKRETKVKFNISEQTPMDEDSISKALADRIANHKAQMASVQTEAATNESIASALLKAPEVVLPRTPRKKVRHVQIQTQHCIMRTMHTQTEPVESLVQDAEVKVLRARPTTAECSTDTADISTSTDQSTSLHSTNAASKSNAKVATTSTSTSTSTSTNTGMPTSVQSPPSNPSTPLTLQEQQELAQLRHQNAALLAQVTSLQRDLAAEARARTRAAVAMQDTREKFEMLSAIAYKKLKEMIFQRHVLEMEVRELRAKVDMQVEEKEMIHQQSQHPYRHQHQHPYQQHHQQQGFVAVGPN
ncbi:hypothetical protein BGX34_010171 [Mortierella sp. NVP85]|nr:hypothetical protein BGX34_010171 [Mortierella sp. NVP85]